MNYLDDFLFIAITLELCSAMVRNFLVLCNQIGCPISDETSERGGQMIVFLRTLMKSKFKILTIPHDNVGVVSTSSSGITGCLCWFLTSFTHGRTELRCQYSSCKCFITKDKMSTEHTVQMRDLTEWQLI